ncbi:MAG: glycoside hydrolase family 38 C-terminal domain-containing protein, partial [Solirubrobacteraceae bacterium]
DIPVVSAMQTDVPGATSALPELLTGAGVLNLSVAHNFAGRSVPYRHGGQRLPRAFRWRTARGRELLVWRTDSLLGSAYMEGNLLGLASGYDDALTALPRYLAALQVTGHPYQGAPDRWLGLPDGVPDLAGAHPFDVLHLRIQGDFADNAPPSLVPAEIARRWNAEWAFPQLRMATNREFFDTLRAEAGDRLPAFEGDWTDWWADGIGSAAREVAMGREAQRSVAVGQTLHSLADLFGGDGDDDADRWRADVDRCYENLTLFDEHTWGAADPWGDDLDGRGSGRLQWQRKSAFALQAYDRAVALRDHGARRLGAALGGGAGSRSEHQITVANLGGGPATDVVQVFVPQAAGLD